MTSLNRSLLAIAFASSLVVYSCSDPDSGSGSTTDSDVELDAALDDSSGDDSGSTDSGSPEDTGSEDDSSVEADGADDVGNPDAVIDIGPTPCADDQCDIDDECVDNGDPNPDNPCEACVVVSSRDTWTPDDSATCDDGDACTTDDYCFEGACMGTVNPCEDGNPCTTGACDAETGECSQETNEASCDDGDPCTAGDVCSSGECLAGTDAAECPEDDNPCTAAFCEPGVGCGIEPLSDTPCDDGDPCTVGDMCMDGMCVPGGDQLECDDGSLCTIDRCVPGVGCEFPSIADRCADDNPCTDETCDPEQGCVYPFNTDPCDDGSLCTEGDICTEGICTGAPVIVDDGNVCTDESCDPLSGPMSMPNTDLCDDGNACTVGDVCDDGSCTAGTDPLVCDDANVCTDNECDPDTGCVFPPNTDPCDDGSVCTVDDICSDGSCTPGPPLDCDDGNACTADSCDAVDGCENTLIISNSCRPRIEVTFPPRAATIDRPADGMITVTGSVSSGAGPITTFTLNGEDVSVGPDGSFSVAYDTRVGSNTLVFFAEDSFASTRDRVQGFHISDVFYDPTPAGDGAVNPGLGLWLGQETLDDGEAPPPTDFAAIFEQVLSGFDLASFFDSDEVLASQAGFDIYLRSLDFEDVAVTLNAVDDGLSINASILDISGRLYFDCTNFGCRLLGGSGGGSLSITSITITAVIGLSANPDGTLAVSVGDPNTTINGLNLSADNGWTNFLLGIVEAFIRDSLVSDFEAELDSQLETVIGPLLADALGALALNLDFPLPSLNPSGDPINVSLATNFSDTIFQDETPGPQGGLLALRAWAQAAERGVPEGDPFDSNQGSPARMGCAESAQTMVVPRTAPLEIVFPDDTLNQILYAAWWGGFLEFPLDPSLLGDLDLAGFGISDLELDVSAWLPPVASDCVDGELRLYVTDLRIDASLALFGQPLDLVVWVSFEAPISLAPADGELQITVSDVENVELEVNVEQESLISSEAVVKDLLVSELVPALGGLLGGGEPLAGFPLPEFDLSDSLGLPPGSLLISIEIIDDPALEPRLEGNTIVYGRLQ